MKPLADSVCALGLFRLFFRPIEIGRFFVPKKVYQELKIVFLAFAQITKNEIYLGRAMFGEFLCDNCFDLAEWTALILKHGVIISDPAV
jgi:hypothetical protein